MNKYKKIKAYGNELNYKNITNIMNILFKLK